MSEDIGIGAFEVSRDEDIAGGVNRGGIAVIPRGASGFPSPQEVAGGGELGKEDIIISGTREGLSEDIDARAFEGSRDEDIAGGVNRGGVAVIR